MPVRAAKVRWSRLLWFVQIREAAVESFVVLDANVGLCPLDADIQEGNHGRKGPISGWAPNAGSQAPWRLDTAIRVYGAFSA